MFNQPSRPLVPSQAGVWTWNRVWLEPVDEATCQTLHRRPPLLALMRRALSGFPLATGSLVTIPARDGVGCVCRCQCEASADLNEPPQVWGSVESSTGIYVEVDPLPGNGEAPGSSGRRLEMPIKPSAREAHNLITGLLRGSIATSHAVGSNHPSDGHAVERTSRRVASVLLHGPHGVGKRHTVRCAAQAAGARVLRLSTAKSPINFRSFPLRKFTNGSNSLCSMFINWWTSPCFM